VKSKVLSFLLNQYIGQLFFKILVRIRKEQRVVLKFYVFLLVDSSL